MIRTELLISQRNSKQETGIQLDTKEQKEAFLWLQEFIYLKGGAVQMGTTRPLVCNVEGFRHNEVPVRTVEVLPFWICQFKVTNVVFERIKTKHRRPPQANKDKCPVVDITYGEAISFCQEINKITGMEFRLPTEPEWVFAAAPVGWEYIHPGDVPDLSQGHVFNDDAENCVVEINDPRWPSNYFGLDQMGHNVCEMTNGHYHIPGGHYGSETDGAYYIAKGGNYGHCKFGLGIHRRLLVDITDRNPRIGFRLTHSKL